MASRTFISRMSMACANRIQTRSQARFLSSQGDACLEKLRSALEEYRAKNYAQELPSRFKKEIAKAAKLGESDGIGLEGMERVIANIDMAHKITRQDMETIFLEVGGESRMISTDSFMKII